MFRKAQRPRSPLSRSAAFLALGFALIAMGTSAAGAWMLTSAFNVAITAVICAVSVLLVLYERSALTWVRARRERTDHRAARWGLAFLVFAALYTAIMQVTFFGTVMLRQVAADEGAKAELANVDKRIAELTTKRTWTPQPKTTAAALAAEVEALERDAKERAPHLREAAKAAALALPAKRAELAGAQGYEAVTAELEAARAERAASISRPAADTKAVVFGWLTGGGHAVTYGMIVLAVLVIQMGQIVLPVVAGKAEIAAAHARAAEILPEALAKAPGKAVDAPKPVAAPKALELPPVQAHGPLAAAAAKLLEDKKAVTRQKRAAARAAKVAAPTGPPGGGLAAKLSRVG